MDNSNNIDRTSKLFKTDCNNNRIPRRRRKFDLITHLEDYPHILERIFSYLKPKHLRSVACVCQGWNRILSESTPKANRQRRESIRKIKFFKENKGQENWPIDVKCAKFKRKLSQYNDDEQFERRKALSSIQNKTTKNYDHSRQSFQSDLHRQQQNDKNNQNIQNYECDRHSEQSKRKNKRWTLAQVPFKSW